jgi:hypothetical protein
MPKLTTGHAAVLLHFRAHDSPMRGCDPWDIAVLDRIQTGDRLFGKESERFIANRIGVDQVIPKSINDSIDKLRKVGPVIRVKRGE